MLCKQHSVFFCLKVYMSPFFYPGGALIVPTWHDSRKAALGTLSE